MVEVIAGVLPAAGIGGLWREAAARLRRNRLAMLGAFFIIVFVLMALLAPLLAPYPPNAGALADSLQPPSLAHLMGTDIQGRDEFSRVLYGARLSLAVGFAAVFIAVLLGGVSGALAGGAGGKGGDGFVLEFDQDGNFKQRIGGTPTAANSNDTTGGLNGTPLLLGFRYNWTP